MRRTSLLILMLLGACTGATSAGDAGLADAGALDSGSDAGPGDAGSVDAGPGSLAPCTFNSDCPAAERCECDETAGCFCRTGARGTGVSGVDPCDGGNQCASSLCVEGNGGYYCSGPCTSPSDCGPRLPLCSDIAFIGQICVRNPDGG